MAGGGQLMRKVYWPDGKSRIIRYHWQPKTYFIDEWGLDKPVPFREKMVFIPRAPFRSRINVYNPKQQKTMLLRAVAKEDQDFTIPARFVAYDVDIHQTVSIRFRVLEEGGQYMEIGALENGLLQRADKI